MTHIAVVFHSNGEHATPLAQAVQIDVRSRRQAAVRRSTGDGDDTTPRWREAAATAALRAAAAARGACT